MMSDRYIDNLGLKKLLNSNMKTGTTLNNSITIKMGKVHVDR